MFESLITLISVTALLLGSPGPAPLALAGTSATFGVRRGIPFLSGILAGLLFAIIGSTIGLGSLLSIYPSAKYILQVVGCVYIVYVASKIAFAPIGGQGDNFVENPPTFSDGFILNLLNPKAYAAFLAIFSQFLLPFEGAVLAFISTGAICFAVACVVDVAWLGLGGFLRSLFTSPRYARALRLVFAVLMLVSVVWALAQ